MSKVLTVPPAIVDARRCYVCGEGSEAPFRTAIAMAATAAVASSSSSSSSSHRHHNSSGSSGGNTLPNIVTTCEDFERDQDELDKYVLECPSTYTSCLTQVDGDMELRTCGESLSINDCKSANKIDYCYCSEDLCNSLKRTQIRREIEDAQSGAQSEHLKQHEPNNSDDEDLSESSGMGDSHERHRLGGHHRTALGGGNHNMHNHLEKDFATTQIVMTLKPIPTTERRNNNGSARDDSAKSATSSGASNCRWSPERSRSNLLTLLLMAGGGLIWRLTWFRGHSELV
ncbi:uncharacterized protein LOC131684012 isoform X2 [Topomyia yanbarensis]|uniref:uncharacterized protein LOC131684012 isoform X2 n=1 Tax=Topomyia yanbarensis TaxID=2498891 RepID=UPI00273B1CEB|nr:uncharacterized protein LOC131684012 isoform X2 [Topomyia yanbarensis]